MSENSSRPKKRTARLRAYSISAALLICLWVMGAFFAVQFVIAGAFVRVLDFIGFFHYDDLSADIKIMVGAAIVYSLTLLLVLILPWLVLKNKTTLKQLGFERLASWWDLVLGPIAFIPYIIASVLLSAIAVSLWPWFDAAQQQDVGLQAVSSGPGMTIAFIALVLIAPIAEEVLFRGYLYGKLREYTGMVVATLLVSVCFGAVHGQWNVAIDVFALSVVMCGLREITGSIWAGIILHMAKNAIAFVALFTYVF